MSAGFWSRRKAAVAAEEAAQDKASAEDAAHRKIAAEEVTQGKAPADAPAAPETDLALPAAEDDAAILARLGLPDPRTLEAGDDFTAFLSDAVPRHLRQIAQARLWRSNPTLACLDGLNDYDDDYRTPAMPAGAVRTAWRQGRGLLPDPEPDAAETDEVTTEAPEAPEAIRPCGPDPAPADSSGGAIAKTAAEEPAPARAGQAAAISGPGRIRFTYAEPHDPAGDAA